MCLDFFFFSVISHGVNRTRNHFFCLFFAWFFFLVFAKKFYPVNIMTAMDGNLFKNVREIRSAKKEIKILFDRESSQNCDLSKMKSLPSSPLQANLDVKSEARFLRNSLKLQIFENGRAVGLICRVRRNDRGEYRNRELWISLFRCRLA